jgi:predicted transcriptional regulator
LRWFGAAHRGFTINQILRDALLKNNLRIEPHLNEPLIEETIEFYEGYELRQFPPTLISGAMEKGFKGEKLREFEISMLNEIWAAIIADHLSGWMDQNPHNTRGAAQAKAEALAELDFDVLITEEAANAEARADDKPQESVGAPQYNDTDLIVIVQRWRTVVPAYFPDRAQLFQNYDNMSRDDSSSQVIPFPTHETFTDPTLRIGKLRSANVALKWVRPNQSIEEAVTLMMMHGLSQLPVMSGERTVKGIITWRSIAKVMALRGGDKKTEVRECMEPPHLKLAQVPLFEAFDDIVKHEYVLPVDGSGKISGIVTTSDLSMELRRETEPFSLLREIENRIRHAIANSNFHRQELNKAAEGYHDKRKINSVSDLTLGEFIRLLENDQNWSKLALSGNRKIFMEGLDEIRKIRNAVMHFRLDTITEDDVRQLRQFATYLQEIGTPVKIAPPS